MALGIDIYRYQTVTDPAAVRRAGVTFAYVKATDGGGPAVVRADHQVAQMKEAGIPVGLYHYAQLKPSPEAQADVLASEVHRLGAVGLPPALDLESPFAPGTAARDFADRFLARLRWLGFHRVTLYANTSMLTGIRGPWLDDDRDIVVWAANYSVNDGKRHTLSYKGRVDIHQFTSVGTVPGISGRVDLNESLTTITGDDDMLSEAQDKLLRETHDAIMNALWNTGATPYQSTIYDSLRDISVKVSELSDDEANVISAMRQIPGADPATFAAALAPVLGPFIQAGATPEQVTDAVREVFASAARGEGSE